MFPLRKELNHLPALCLTSSNPTAFHSLRHPCWGQSNPKALAKGTNPRSAQPWCYPYPMCAPLEISQPILQCERANKALPQHSTSSWEPSPCLEKVRSSVCCAAEGRSQGDSSSTQLCNMALLQEICLSKHFHTSQPQTVIH